MSGNNILKFIAIITMTIDHIGAILYPQCNILRIIGRLSFPIFAYQTSVGVDKTSDIKKYMLRLLIFAILSQPIYTMCFPYDWNAIATIAYGAMVLILWTNEVSICKILSVLMIVVSYFISKMGYGIYGILMIFGFYIFKDKKKLCALFFVIITIAYSLTIGVREQFAAILALPLIYKVRNMNIHFPKYFFYIYYPLHLLILFYAKIYFF